MVVVNAGNNKGQKGKVLSVLVSKQRAIVEGVNREVSSSRRLRYIFPTSTSLTLRQEKQHVSVGKSGRTAN